MPIGLPFMEAGSFNGSSHVKTRNNTLSGVVNGSVGTGSFHFKRSNNGLDEKLLAGYLNSFIISINASGAISISARVAETATVALTLRSSNDYDDGEWHHCMYAWDTSNSNNIHMYIDGVSDAVVSSMTASATLDYTANQWAFGARITGTGPFTYANYLSAEVAEFLLDFSTYTDLSDADNRGLFYNGDKRIYLGANGEIPLSGTPDLYFAGSDDFDNLGGAGTFVDGSGTIGIGTPPTLVHPENAISVVT